MMEVARRWREKADRLLAESNLLQLLRNYGEVHFSGGYAYKLMMSPDIDIHLVLHKLKREVAVQVLGDLVDQGRWRTVTFADRVDERLRSPTAGGVPRGYYVGVRTDFDGERWKVDIWLLEQARYRGDVWGPIMQSITDEQRDAILEMKAARSQGKISATGVQIYEAVLQAGIRTVEEFHRLTTEKQRSTDATT